MAYDPELNYLEDDIIMKKYISIVLCCMLCFAVLSGCVVGTGGSGSAPSPVPASPEPVPEPAPSPEPEPPQVEGPFPDEIPGTITMEDGGVIKFELYTNRAPQSVYNFVYLARQGFYEGLVFHRIMDGFMIQGGCPDGNGGGNPGYAIFGEFEANGFPNPTRHTRGVMSMARTDVFDSAGSQFFICHGDPVFLNGNYAAFGRVTDGMDVVDEIASIPNNGPNGAVDPSLMPVIRSITIDSDVVLPWPNKLPRP